MKSLRNCLLLLLILGLMPLPVRAAAGTQGLWGSLTWSVAGDCLTLSGTGPMEEAEVYPWASLRPTLRQVVLEEGITAAAPRAFRNFSCLRRISLPSTLEALGRDAFEGTAYAARAGNWTDSGLYLDGWLLEGTNISRLAVAEGTVGIADEALFPCGLLTSLSLPASMRHVGKNLTADSPSFSAVEISPENPRFRTEDGILLTRDGTALVLFPCGSARETFSPGPELRELRPWSAARCRRLKKLSLPDSLEEIGTGALFRCTGLTALELPPGVTSIGARAFEGSGLTRITLPGGLQKLGADAFAACSSLRDVFFAGTREQWSRLHPGGLPPDAVLHCKEEGRPFRDVAPEAWYAPAVNYVWQHGLMRGHGPGVFAPDGQLTRAQLAQILYNRAGSPAVRPANPFRDVPENAWYRDPVVWAEACGLVHGYGQGRFGPEDPITRQQLAAILYRCAGSPPTAGSLSGFADRESADAYAAVPLAWAVEAGILRGKGGGILDPRGSARRCEVAQMIMNFQIRTEAP